MWPTRNGKTTSSRWKDPIEILQEAKKCQITQRQVGIHTNSYSRALRAALREDPDIIVIGEMFDLETIEKRHHRRGNRTPDTWSSEPFTPATRPTR